MKSTTILCLAIAATAFAGPANAIFKCTTAKGVVYQDRPCRDGNETDVTIVIPTGEMAPRASGATDDSAQPQLPRRRQDGAGARAQRNAGRPVGTDYEARRNAETRSQPRRPPKPRRSGAFPWSWKR